VCVCVCVCAFVTGSPTDHCFRLPDMSGNPEGCVGIRGVMEAYNMALQSVTLSGPTLFAQVIGQACALAASAGTSQMNQKYFVLLIITDGERGSVSCVAVPLVGEVFSWACVFPGVINDMDATIASIVAAADLPLSILIVGVGSADFSMMETLDGDEVRLSYNGKPASRDIVQFVPTRNHLTVLPSGYPVVNQHSIAKALLEEIPDQLLLYMKQHGIVPNPRPSYTTAGSAAPADSSYRPELSTVWSGCVVVPMSPALCTVVAVCC
jgi:Copine